MYNHSRLMILILVVLLCLPGSAIAQSIRWEANKETLTRLFEPSILGNGQKSRFTANKRLDFGENSFVRWDVDIEGVPEAVRAQILPVLRSSLVWAANRDMRRDDDENLVALLAHGSVSSGDFGRYNERVYLARLYVAGGESGTQGFTHWARENRELAAAIVDNESAKIVFTATRLSTKPSSFGDMYGGGGGQAKEIVIPDLPGWRITELWIKDGDVIDTVVVHYTDGQGFFKSQRFGNAFNEADVKKIRIDPKESIIEVSGRTGRLVDRLCLETTAGWSGCYGGDGGRQFPAQHAPPDHVLVGFQFRCGDRIDAIRPVWRAL